MRELIVAIITLIVGFIFLIKGADFFVDGSASVAKRLRVPSIIIGMTVVAMGTSLPECAVSVTASITNNNSLAVSNAVGSNIFNLMVVCGVCALFTPLAVQRDTLKRDLPFSIIVAGLLLVLGYFGMTLGRVDGIILLVVFAVFLVIMVKSALKARRDGGVTAAEKEDQEIADEVEILPVWKCIVFIIVGAIGIALGGDAVVDGASVIAAEFGLSQSENRGAQTSHGLSYQKLGKELMTQDEIAVMDGGKCILQLRGVRPFFSDKFDITKHPRYQYLSDADKRNVFDVERYMKRRPAIVKPDEPFDMYELNASDLEPDNNNSTKRKEK